MKYFLIFVLGYFFIGAFLYPIMAMSFDKYAEEQHEEIPFSWWKFFVITASWPWYIITKAQDYSSLAFVQIVLFIAKVMSKDKGTYDK